MKRESSPSECWARTGAISNASIDRVVSRRMVSRRNVRSHQGSAMIFVRVVSARVQGIRILDSIRGEQ
jgi:hypothetical protein